MSGGQPRSESSTGMRKNDMYEAAYVAYEVCTSINLDLSRAQVYYGLRHYEASSEARLRLW